MLSLLSNIYPSHLVIFRQLKHTWYQMMAQLENEQRGQIYGVVQVIYFCGFDKTGPHFFSFTNRAAKLDLALPYRASALHFCSNQMGLKSIFDLVRWPLSKHDRMRFRTHFGSSLEIEYSLMTFGIKNLPLKEDGSVKIELHEQFVREQKEKEQARQRQEDSTAAETGKFAYPSPIDVLLGRGKSYQEFPGNQRMGRIVDSYREAYHHLVDSVDKQSLSTNLVKMIQESGTRFLQRQSDRWVIVDDRIARTKIRDVLRTNRYDSATLRSTAADATERQRSQPNAKRVRYNDISDKS